MKLRRATSNDVSGILLLINHVFGTNRSAEWFHHVHMQNPAGNSIIYVAEDDAGNIVSYRSLIMVKGYYRGRLLKCAQLADASTHPDFRGQGLFSRLNEMALQDFFESGGDLVFSFPGPMSYKIYVNRLGFKYLGSISQVVFPSGSYPSYHCRAVSIVSSLHNLAFARRTDPSEFVIRRADEKCLPSLGLLSSDLLCFQRDSSWMNWRLSVPGRSYWVIEHREAQVFAIVGTVERKGLRIGTILETGPASSDHSRLLLRPAAMWAKEGGLAGVLTWARRGLPSYIVNGYFPTGRRTRVVARFAPCFQYEELTRDLSKYRLNLLDTDAY